MFKVVTALLVVLYLTQATSGVALDSKYFTAAEWISRSGEIALSIYHKRVSIINARESFNELEAQFGNDPEWDNPDSLYAQYVCHVMFAPFKNPWNIEPHRTESDLIEVVAGKCNPDYLFKLFKGIL